jgi:chondroitin 4-sulfotransferase 11
MIISDSHKFIFVKIPKSAGTSISNYLDPYLNQGFRNLDLGDHEPLAVDYTGSNEEQTISAILKKNNIDADNYFKFSFVRNPWDVRVSRYFYLRDTEIAYNTERNLPTNTSALYLDFKPWCLSSGWFPCRNWPHKNKTKGGQIGFLQNDNLEIDIDYIGKFENLQEDFNNICDQIGIENKKLPHHNKSKHKHYTEYYDDETRQIVAEKYAKDIEYFGYKFGE